MTANEKGDKGGVTQIVNDAALAKTIFHDAKAATLEEHETNFWQGLKQYPKAVAWTIVVCMAVVMDGFDENLIKSLYAESSFQKKFGHPAKKGYQLSAPWQSGLSNASVVGIIMGLCLNGYVREKIGMRRTMLTACVMLIAFVFILVFATSAAMLLVGELLCGICWGIFHSTAPIFASEVCPTVLRGYLTTFINLAAV